MTTALTTPQDSGAAIAEQVIIKGDLAKLTEAERMAYYSEVCRSLGLNPLTRPFEYITLNNKLTLYATRGAADQLRSIRGITITNLEPRQVGDLLVVIASGRDRTGREDSSTGAVSVKGLSGEALANAMMKAETKAKRRLTLSLAGLGWPDETEVASIPGAVLEAQDKPLTLAERVAVKAAEVLPLADARDEAAMEELGEIATGVTYDAEPVPVAEGQETLALAEEPHGMTVAQFRDAMSAALIAPEFVKSVRTTMYPNAKTVADLSDDERGRLADEILR